LALTTRPLVMFISRSRWHTYLRNFHF